MGLDYNEVKIIATQKLIFKSEALSHMCVNFIISPKLAWIAGAITVRYNNKKNRYTSSLVQTVTWAMAYKGAQYLNTPGPPAPGGEGGGF